MFQAYSCATLSLLVQITCIINMAIGGTMVYHPKMLTPMGVIAIVSASSLRLKSMMKIISLKLVGVIVALYVSRVNLLCKYLRLI